MSKQIIETLKKGLSNKNLTDAQRKSVQAKIDALEEVENKSESSNKPSENKSNSVIETLKKGLSNKNLTDAQRKSVQAKIEALEKAESKTEAKKEKVVKQPKEKKEKVVKQPKEKKENISVVDYDCDTLISKEKEKAKKRKEAAEKRKNAPKKKESTKIKEGIERLEDKVEEKVSKGKITKAEIIKLIDNTKALLKSLEKQLKEFGTNQNG